MHTSRSAFTLVELIVVITIIAILGSVGFVSYTSYLAGARDTNRIVQMDAIHKALTLFTLRSRLPIPESAVEIYDGDQLLGYQGYISATQLETISYSQGGKDPKTAKYFTYTIDARKKHSQLLAYLEEPVPSSLQAYGISTSFADDYDNLYPYSIGDALGVILTETTQEPLQEVVSGNIDLSSATDGEYVAHFTGAENSSGSGDQIVGAIEENRGGSGGGNSGAATTNVTDPQCYTAPVNTLGEWNGCNGMLIVDRAMLRAAGNTTTVDHSINYNGVLYTFGDSDKYIFTGQVTDMHNVFAINTHFNTDIGYWDVSNVTNMYRMFALATKFNQDLRDWDTSNVTNMSKMFNHAYAFNGDISTWDLSAGVDMSYMLNNSRSFNQDLRDWDTSNVTNYKLFDYNTFAWQSDYKPNF